MKPIFINGKEFKPVPQENGLFVSDDGIIASTRKRHYGHNGEPTLLKLYKDKYGYLSTDSIVKRRRMVHDSVLSAWHRERISGEVCRHINGIRSDNRLANLAWGTPRENYRDTANHGSLKGVKNPQAKMTPDFVIQLRRQAQQMGINRTVITHSEKFSKFAIWAAITGYTWAHIPGAIQTKRRCTKHGWRNGMILRPEPLSA